MKEFYGFKILEKGNNSLIKKDFRFTRITEGYNVGSLKGMLKKVKKMKILRLSIKYKINNQTKKIDKLKYTDKEKIIDLILNKLNDYQMKELLSNFKDKHIMPCMLKKFIRNRDRAIKEGYILGN